MLFFRPRSDVTLDLPVEKIKANNHNQESEYYQYHFYCIFMLFIPCYTVIIACHFVPFHT